MAEPVSDLCCAVDVAFDRTRPTFGDLLQLCGQQTTSFPRSGAFDARSLADLQFEQIDDYFGVRVRSTGSVVIWMYLLVEGRVVEQHPGPFDGVRLDYELSEHTPSRAAHFALVIRELSAAVPSLVSWTVDGTPLSQPISDEIIGQRIDACLAGH